MNLVRITDAPQYVPTNHPGVTSRRVQGREAGGPQEVLVSVSEYPPGSGGYSLVSPTEVVYLVMEGNLRVEHGNSYDDLSTGDSISFAPGEHRSAHNVGTESARLVVIHRPGFDA